MKKELICIICPRGCNITAQGVGGELKVEGFACKRGEQYAISELTAPKRTITSSVRVEGREERLPVKTEEPIDKDKIFEAMKLIRAASPKPPIKRGDAVIEDVFGTRIIAAADID